MLSGILHILQVNRPITQTVFMLSIAINRATSVCAVVIIEHHCIYLCASITQNSELRSLFNIKYEELAI